MLTTLSGEAKSWIAGAAAVIVVITALVVGIIIYRRKKHGPPSATGTIIHRDPPADGGYLQPRPEIDPSSIESMNAGTRFTRGQIVHHGPRPGQSLPELQGESIELANMQRHQNAYHGEGRRRFSWEELQGEEPGSIGQIQRHNHSTPVLNNYAGPAAQSRPNSSQSAPFPQGNRSQGNLSAFSGPTNEIPGYPRPSLPVNPPNTPWYGNRNPSSVTPPAASTSQTPTIPEIIVTPQRETQPETQPENELPDPALLAEYHQQLATYYAEAARLSNASRAAFSAAEYIASRPPNRLSRDLLQGLPSYGSAGSQFGPNHTGRCVVLNHDEIFAGLATPATDYFGNIHHLLTTPPQPPREYQPYRPSVVSPTEEATEDRDGRQELEG
jgi:hypothetical protein